MAFSPSTAQVAVKFSLAARLPLSLRVNIIIAAADTFPLFYAFYILLFSEPQQGNISSMCSSSSASQPAASHLLCIGASTSCASSKSIGNFLLLLFYILRPASAYDSFSSTIRMLLIFLFCCYVLALELLRIYFSSPLWWYFPLFWWSEIFSPLISNPLFYARLLLLLLRIFALLLWVWQSLGWSRRCCFAWLRAREREKARLRERKKAKNPEEEEEQRKKLSFFLLLAELVLAYYCLQKKKKGTKKIKTSSRHSSSIWWYLVVCCETKYCIKHRFLQECGGWLWLDAEESGDWSRVEELSTKSCRYNNISVMAR